MSTSNDEYIKAVNRFRKQKDNMFGTHNGPLTHEQIEKPFSGLKYFLPNPKYRFSVKIDKFPKITTIQMATNKGEVRIHNVYGIVKFKIDSNQYQLNVYTTNDNPDYYFIPFVDGTSGTETYGAGRYAELEADYEHRGSYILDFNMAYNPYCAYNDNWVCPIPPKENRLKVRIEAGEKIFREHLESNES